MVFILKGRKEQRAAHWNQIKEIVRTHEGELLTGRKGIEYQRKWSRRYLGKDLGNTKPITADRVEQYEKTRK